MKRALAVAVLTCLLIGVVACGDRNTYAETPSIIQRKEVIGNNQYYFYVEYEIEGYEGTFEASIKVPNRAIFDRYNVGDTYVFKRPVPKN